jgi:hypothetical protein
VACRAHLGVTTGAGGSRGAAVGPVHRCPQSAEGRAVTTGGVATTAGRALLRSGLLRPPGPRALLRTIREVARGAILRGAKERLDAQQRPPAPVLELVRPE